ncbi:S-layer homology domain-containing protein, partial [bacterium]|nr:S-layer homology domain-containing protein [bacterium]
PSDKIPVVTGEACPCETQEPAECNEVPKCEPNPIPSCSLCPSAKDLSRADMRQVYSYPNAIYGYNNFIGTERDSIYRAEGFSVNGSQGLTASTMGAAVAPDGSVTGAASNIPCLNDLSNHMGAPILRDDAKIDGNGCPIQMGTANSIQAIKKTLVPLDLTPFENLSNMTGAAANMMQMFPDVPNSHWAACEIDKLAINDVVVGYPDRLYKPYRNISRAEFATMLVKGFNKDILSSQKEKLFTDVPTNHWANSAITAAVHNDLLKGYPNGTFMPNNNVTRVEALCAMSKAIQCGEMSACDAKAVLAKYSDGGQVPDWAQIPIAKALDKGALSNSPNPNKINPFGEATRADIAAMLQNIRVASGLDNNPVTANNDCPVCPLDKKAFIEEEEIVKIPTLKLKFKDQVSAKSSHVGQRFAAKTLEDVTINGQLYPCGSNVYGKVVEVVRPSGCQKGALKLAFTEIENCGHRAALPQQILNAEINKSNTPNIVSRIVTAPLTWSGQMLGIVGRTTGGMLSSLGNSLEDVASGTGIALGEAFQGQFMASARSIGDVLYDTVKTPVDITRTAVSGTIGLAQATGDEIGYLVDAKGYKISAINPRERVTIAFGCNAK